MLSIWLTSGIVFDGATARSYFLRSGCDDLGAVTVLAAACKLVIMILEEIPKKKYVKTSNTGTATEEELPGKEAVSGFWNRTLYLWLNETFRAGFKQNLSIDQLDNLGPEFSSKMLSETFQTVWSDGMFTSEVATLRTRSVAIDEIHVADKKSKYALAITCLRILRLPTLSIVPPRLCFTFFMFIQPYFLRAVVSALQNGAPMPHKWGLVAAGGLIYFGVAVRIDVNIARRSTDYSLVLTVSVPAFDLSIDNAGSWSLSRRYLGQITGSVIPWQSERHGCHTHDHGH